MAHSQIAFRGFTPPLLYFLFETSSIPRFRVLEIFELNLSREHRFLHRVTQFSSITTLNLDTCLTQSAAQLGRFVTSFPSLKTFSLRSWSLPPSGLKDTRIRGSRSKASITELNLRLAPNISGLLDYFLKSEPFVTHLEKLALGWEYIEYAAYHVSLLHGIDELFQHCSLHLESLKVEVNSSEDLFESFRAQTAKIG